jgi:5-methylcytosine-specific restriction endonuclease McrA
MPYKNSDAYRAYQRKWYHLNKAKRTATRKRNRVRIAKWFDEYRLGLQCSICFENHPACIVFHHRNERTKSFEVSVGVAKAVGIEKILREIAKCNVLCVNCHLVSHASRQKRSRRKILARQKGRSPYALEP